MIVHLTCFCVFAITSDTGRRSEGASQKSEYNYQRDGPVKPEWPGMVMFYSHWVAVVNILSVWMIVLRTIN
jgi:hypothetical protein